MSEEKVIIQPGVNDANVITPSQEESDVQATTAAAKKIKWGKKSKKSGNSWKKRERFMTFNDFHKVQNDFDIEKLQPGEEIVYNTRLRNNVQPGFDTICQVYPKVVIDAPPVLLGTHEIHDKAVVNTDLESSLHHV
eukprot:Platyproteum_vivax@DN7634_c1_g3_i1.p1